MYIIVHCTILSLLAILESTGSLMVKILIVWAQSLRSLFLLLQSGRREGCRCWRHLPRRDLPPLGEHEMLLLSPCLSFRTEFRARICKHLTNSGNWFQGIDSASLCSLVGRYAITGPTRIHMLEESIPGLLKRLQIWAQSKVRRG
jgi:hypothetical protein